MTVPPLRFIAILLLGLIAFSGTQAQDGIFADFVTSKGNFTCQLAYDKVPRTVASFMGLATGERPWTDFKRGSTSQRHFYDGLTFHRVVSGFVIQGGSPKGDGSDGPGYIFRDEINPLLRHSKAGILSMANSGPNSNGSQFFVTLAAASYLDDSYSVFGEVTSGMDVVSAIGAVAVNANGLPNTPVLINSVTIRRVGTAAQAFDLNAQDVPAISSATAPLKSVGGKFFMPIAPDERSEYAVHSSADLSTWTSAVLGFSNAVQTAFDLDLSTTASGKSSQFYRLIKTSYPLPIYSPATMANQQLHYVINATETLDVIFDGTGTGGTTKVTDTVTGTDGKPTTSVSSGTITSNTAWYPSPYSGQLYLYSTALPTIVFKNSFKSAAGGSYNATVYSTTTFQLSGDFTMSSTVAPLAIRSTASALSTASAKGASAKTTTKTALAKRTAKSAR